MRFKIVEYALIGAEHHGMFVDAFDRHMTALRRYKPSMLHRTEHLVVKFRVAAALYQIHTAATAVCSDMDENHHHTFVSLLYRLPRIDDLRINVQNRARVYAQLFRSCQIRYRFDAATS